ERIATEEIEKLAHEGPTAEELNRAKTKWEFAYVTGLERIGGFGGKADLLNRYNVFLGHPDGFAADVNRHRSVTPESMKTAATKWLDIRNRVVVRFHPENFRADQAQVDRAKQPELGADRPFQAPSVQTAKLDNGMQIYVVERKDLPKVAVHLATRAGSVDDPTGKEG